jgi:hypothetical protein
MWWSKISVNTRHTNEILESTGHILPENPEGTIVAIVVSKVKINVASETQMMSYVEYGITIHTHCSSG